MVNRPKNIGTAAETAVVTVLREYWPDAKREPLRGNRDEGDIRTGPIVWEIKGGNAARGSASTGSVGPVLLAEWMQQTETERVHAGARFGVLITARKGYGAQRAHRWWAHVRADQFAEMFGAGGHVNGAPVRLELAHLLGILDDMGWTPDAA